MMVRPTRRARGFGYIGLVLMVAVIGVAAAATLRLGAVAQRRAAEEELLAIGTEFRDAFISYANATPPGQPRTPPSLQALLKDPRYPTPRRHLRKLYVDPLTGEDGWGTIQAVPGPGIMGVYSMSNGKPIKIGNFDLRFQDFEGKTTYREWKFMPPQEMIAPVVKGVGGVGGVGGTVGAGGAAASPGAVAPGAAQPAVRF
ncbi:type II secretion system protein [Cupriavidus sp. CV2]|uniref:type II secretion system protein n=1 Tax=Cupriavidus ulmosensis TaxID=3065913 RepID=UPI00296AA7BC|nr:type II secretion system protein [Cupriavidus sp. CV2]MDW3682865.1 type II secretion system protein [Cupriavidus sp. CV2]